MQVLRDNKESLMAVLEAFVYDPLINWRLMQTEVEVRRPEGMISTQYFQRELSLTTFSDDISDPARAAELARVAGHPQGPMRKLKADEKDRKSVV